MRHDAPASHRRRQVLGMAAAAVATLGPPPRARAAATDGSGPAPGDTWVYRLQDRASPGQSREVQLRVDSVGGDRVVFNGGQRIEGPQGELLERDGSLGAADLDAPERGWGAMLQVDLHRRLVYEARGRRFRLDVRDLGEADHAITGGSVAAHRFALAGWVTLQSSRVAMTAEARYAAQLWLERASGRVLRFEAQMTVPFSAGTSWDRTDEVLQLIDRVPAGAAAIDGGGGPV